VFIGGKDGFFYALTLADGKVAWKSKPMRTLTAAPVAGEGTVWIQGFYGTTQAFDINTGEEQSRMSLGGSLQSTPIVTEEAVYLATYPGVVYAVR
jgi:outer membrane protein assembly factor BamB